jgi:hypothetical protein
MASNQVLSPARKDGGHFALQELSSGEIMAFFSSDIGVAIAWLCGVAGFVYAFVQKQANISLQVQLQDSQNQVLNLKNSMNVENDASKNAVSQAGEKNVYTKTNAGGMTINM